MRKQPFKRVKNVGYFKITEKLSFGVCIKCMYKSADMGINCMRRIPYVWPRCFGNACRFFVCLMNQWTSNIHCIITKV